MAQLVIWAILMGVLGGLLVAWVTYVVRTTRERRRMVEELIERLREP
jgi:hypothetical protein